MSKRLGIIMLHVLSIAIGGAVGAVARYLVVQTLMQWQGKPFPWGTLAVNIIGSFLIGLCYVLIVEKTVLPDEYRAVLVTGFLGAFTTFSAFSLDALNLYERGDGFLALAYVFSSVILCLLAVAASVALGRMSF